MKNEVVKVAQLLAKEGKTPSVALIKSRLANPLSLTQIIQGLKSWQANPNVVIDAPEASNQAAHTPDPVALKIAAAIAPLNQEIYALKQELADIKQLVKQKI